MSIPPIDTSFDFKTEPYSRVDPDRRSPTLQRYQRMLFEKPLPSGAMFTLSEKTAGRDRILRHESDLGYFELSSDTILNSSKGPLKSLYEQMPTEANLAWHRGVIGARILFPSNTVNGKWTINQARGMHQAIRDRFDLTLEAIRRHYAGELSPLAGVLDRYSSFFALFETFEGYVDFFLLNDLVSKSGEIRYFLPFESFERRPLPSTFEEYRSFRSLQLEFLFARTVRIDEYQRTYLMPAAS